VLVDKLVYRFHAPKPGDVVVFKGPDAWTKNDADIPRTSNILVRGLQQLGSLVGLAPPDERDFVKRVVAVGGQTVECCDANNHVLVDGKPLSEPYIYWEPGRPSTQQSFPKVRVPDGTLWVLGDNRNDSCDSRCQGGGSAVNGGLDGVVPVGNVIGKARYVVLPPSRWRGVGDHDPQSAAQALGAPAWQQGLPAGIGFLGAIPVLWLGRRLRRKRPGSLQEWSMSDTRRTTRTTRTRKHKQPSLGVPTAPKAPPPKKRNPRSSSGHGRLRSLGRSGRNSRS
jgi:signal peptidase I